MRPLEVGHLRKVIIETKESGTEFEALSRDPNIIRRNGRSLAPEVGRYRGEVRGGRQRYVAYQDAWSLQEFLPKGAVLSGSRPILESEEELPGHDHRDNEL